jgi:prepilin-type N-terminal cleavage/methylation domain-containing protein
MQQIKDFKRGFTLVELLLAIFLVGLLSYFVFSNVGETTKPKEVVTIKNLPRVFQKNLNGDGEMVCVNKCSECYYITSNGKPQNAPLPLPLKVTNEYILDKNNNPTKIELGRLNDKKVCMRLKHYTNGSISQVILEVNGEYIFIPSYFGEGKKFETLGEATEYWLKDSQGKLESRGDWY